MLSNVVLIMVISKLVVTFMISVAKCLCLYIENLYGGEGAIGIFIFGSILAIQKPNAKKHNTRPTFFSKEGII